MSDPKEDLEEKQKIRKMTQRQREIYSQKLKEIRDNPDPSVLGEDGRIDLAKAIEKAQQLAQDIEFRELNRAKNANTFESVLLKEKNAIRKDTDHSMKDYLGESLGKKDNSFFNTELNKYANKFAIDKVAQEYKGKTKNADIQKLLENVSKYTEIVDSNADAVKGIRGEDRIDSEVKRSLKREAMIQNKITRDAEKLFEKLQKDLSDAMEKVTPVEIDGKVIYEDANIKQLSDELRMVTGIFEYFDALKTGSLEVPEDQVIDYSFTAVKRTISGDRNIDLDKDEPLFAHEPTPDDIVQGDLGDCYFMSALASMAKSSPKTIRSAICDNGDGTCTVRFFNRVQGKDGPGHGDTFEPVYVKVKKTVPEIGGASNSAPWVSIMERAYAASGLYISENGTTYNYQRYQKTQNFEKLYYELKSKDRSDWPSHQECPALIDKNGDLHKYQPSYEQIVGGSAAYVVEAIGGENYKAAVKGELLEVDSYVDGYMQDFFTKLYEQSDAILAGKDQNYRLMKENLGRSDYVEMLYVAAFGPKSQIPRTPDGSIDVTKTEVKAAVQFVMALQGAARDVFNIDPKKQLPDDYKEKIWSNFNQLVGLELQKSESALAELYKGDRESFIKFSDALTDGKANIDSPGFDYFKKDRHTGEYNSLQNKLFEDIKRAAGSNMSNVTIGTKDAPDKTDRDSFDGLFFGHSYTVEGTTTRRLGGKDYKFLIVRNPHASNVGRTYAYNANTNSIEPKSTTTKNGISYIELSDLADCGGLGINKFNTHEPEKLTDEIDMSTMSKYSRVLETFEKEMKSAYSLIGTKDSKEYKTLKDAVSEMKKNVERGFKRDQNYLYVWAESVKEAAKAYLKHCDDTPEKSGKVRNQRMKAAEGLQKLTSDIMKSFEKGEPLKDPKGKMKENLIGKLIQGINITKPLDAKENRRIANELRNDDDFGKACGNYLNLYDKSKSTPQELVQEFGGLVQKHMQPVKEQHQPQNDIQKANEIQQNVLSSL